jgi:ubiquinone/menaquinone biosynthesis C-methylase UbiE
MMPNSKLNTLVAPSGEATLHGIRAAISVGHEAAGAIETLCGRGLGSGIDGDIRLCGPHAATTAGRLVQLWPRLQVSVVRYEHIAAEARDFDIVLTDLRSPARELVAIHGACRRAGTPVIASMPCPWGPALFLFTPDGMSFEQFFSVPADAALSDHWTVPLDRLLPASHSQLASTLEAVMAKRTALDEAALASYQTALAQMVCDVIEEVPVPVVPRVVLADLLTACTEEIDYTNAVAEQMSSIWTRISPVYDRALMPPDGRTVYADVLERMARAFDGCHRILEAGVGTGLIAERLAEAGHEVVGIDLNHGMLAHARRRAARFGDRMRVGEGNVERLFFANDSFDGYCSNNVVFDADIEKAMREAWRVLRPGGKLALNSLKAVPSVEKLGGPAMLASMGVAVEVAEEFIRCQQSIWDGRALKYGIRLHAEDKIRTLLEGLGFVDVAFTAETYAGISFFVEARKP